MKVGQSRTEHGLETKDIKEMLRLSVGMTWMDRTRK